MPEWGSGSYKVSTEYGVANVTNRTLEAVGSLSVEMVLTGGTRQDLRRSEWSVDFRIDKQGFLPIFTT